MKIETARSTAIRRVLRSVARHAVDPLPVRGEDGRFPIVVALPADTLADVDQRRMRAGGDVNLFVAYADTFVVVTMTNGDEGDRDATEPADVHRDSTIDMVLYWRRQQPDGRGSIRVGTDVLKDVREFDYSL